MVLKKKYMFAGLAVLALAPLVSQADDSNMWGGKVEISDWSTGKAVIIGGKALNTSNAGDLETINHEITGADGKQNACIVEAIARVNGALAPLQSDWANAKASYAAAKDAKAPGCGKEWDTHYQILARVSLHVPDRNPMMVNNKITNPNYGKADLYAIAFFAQSVATDGTVSYLPIAGVPSDKLLKTTPNEPVQFSGLMSDTVPCPRIDSELLSHISMQHLQAATNDTIRASMKANCSSASGSLTNKLDNAFHVANPDAPADTTSDDTTIKVQKFGPQAGKPND